MSCDKNLRYFAGQLRNQRKERPFRPFGLRRRLAQRELRLNRRLTFHHFPNFFFTLQKATCWKLGKFLQSKTYSYYVVLFFLVFATIFFAWLITAWVGWKNQEAYNYEGSNNAQGCHKFKLKGLEWTTQFKFNLGQVSRLQILCQH